MQGSEAQDPSTALQLPKGSDLVMQVHYHPSGKPEQDRSMVGIIFAKTAPRERVATLPISNPTFVIPPGASNYRVDASASSWTV